MKTKFQKYNTFKKASRLILGITYALTLIVMIICANVDFSKDPIPISEDNITIKNTYDEFFDSSTLEITVKSPTNEGIVYIDLTLYDELDKPLASDFYKGNVINGIANIKIDRIEGQVAKYTIEECLNAFPDDVGTTISIFLIIPSFVLLAYFVVALQIKNDLYNINGTMVHVYLGFRKHELYINGNLVDYSNHLNQFGRKKLNSSSEGKFYEIEYKSSRKYKLKADGNLILRDQRIKKQK